MDLVKTRLQLIRETANKLRIVGTGQSLEPEYSLEIDDRIDPLFLQLSGDNICHVNDSNNIPGEWFDPLAGLLANLCAPMGGKNFSPEIKEYYERSLRRINAAKTTYEPTTTEYF